MRIGLCAAVLCCSSLTLSLAGPADASIRKTTNIPAEPLSDALRTLAKDRQFEVLYRAEAVRDIRTDGAIGEYTNEEALKQLLMGTGLNYKYLDGNTVTVFAAPSPIAAAASSDSQTTSDAASKSSASKEGDKSSNSFRLAQVGQANTGPQVASDVTPKKDENLTEIVVTGTHIHDTPSLVPITTLTHDEIVAQGYTRIDQALASLPQNFSGGGASQDSNGIIGGPGNVGQNLTYSSGVNLRGLGPGATLVLLNGRRLPATSFGDSTDISQIPLSVVERIEVLTDGASSAYGSDAIAGVVNIITRKTFTGVETDAWSNGIAAGKAPNAGGSITGGVNWSGGNLVTSINYDESQPLFARDRTFASGAPNPTNLLPKQEMLGAYVGLHQDITDSLIFSSDILASRRQFSAEAPQPFYPTPTVLTNTGEAKVLDASAQLDYRFLNGWTATLNGTFSEEKDPTYQSYVGTSPEQQYFSPLEYRTTGAELRIDGPLAALPAGALRVAAGGSFRHESFSKETELYDGIPADTSITTEASSRSTSAAFLEAFVPLVSQAENVPLVRSLTLDLAARVDHYSDFGSTTNPSASLRWEIVDGFSVYGKASRSFRAPTLYELSLVGSQAIIYDAPTSSSPTAGTTPLLMLFGGNPALTPEHAKSFEGGFEFKPSSRQPFSATVSYFHIDYTDRIVNLGNEGFGPNAIAEANILGSLVNLHPTAAQIAQQLAVPGREVDYYSVCMMPSCIQAIALLNYINVGMSSVDGIDGTLNYSHDVGGGQLAVNWQATYLLNFNNRLTGDSPEYTILNTVGNPLRLRTKLNVGWTRAGFGSYVRLNHTGAYRNPSDTTCSSLGCPVSSWTPMDLGVSYSTPSTFGRFSGGWRVSVDMLNVFNQAPPFVNNVFNPNNNGGGFSPGLNYDPVNASALVRSVGISISKKWN